MARICWRRSTGVLLTVLWFKWSVKKLCLAKVLPAIWESFLHDNNHNYNSYRFSYKFAFILFLPFLTNEKQESSASWWSGNKKYLCFLFIVSCALLQSHVEFKRLLWGNFFKCYSSSYYSSMTTSKFVTRKCIAVKDLPGSHYSVYKNIRFKTPMPRSDLCDNSDVYIVVKGTVIF